MAEADKIMTGYISVAMSIVDEHGLSLDPEELKPGVLIQVHFKSGVYKLFRFKKLESGIVVVSPFDSSSEVPLRQYEIEKIRILGHDLTGIISTHIIELHHKNKELTKRLERIEARLSNLSS